MSTYRGPAWVSAPGTGPIQVYADLTREIDPRDGAPEWLGELDGPVAWSGIGEEPFELRLPDGRTGQVVIVREEAPGSERTQVLGVGPAPFDP